jgi:hypothetical protein
MTNYLNDAVVYISDAPSYSYTTEIGEPVTGIKANFKNTQSFKDVIVGLVTKEVFAYETLEKAGIATPDILINHGYKKPIYVLAHYNDDTELFSVVQEYTTDKEGKKIAIKTDSYTAEEYINIIVDDIQKKIKNNNLDFDSMVLISCLSANNYKNGRTVFGGKNPMESVKSLISEKLKKDIPVFAPNKIITASEGASIITLTFKNNPNRENNSMGRLKSTLSM